MLLTSEANWLRTLLTWTMPVAVVGTFAGGCSTDSIPVAPQLRSQEMVERGGDAREDRRFLTLYSDDFQLLYREEKPWRNYMLVYLGVQFLARDGLERYRDREAQEDGGDYPGIEKFLTLTRSHDGAWQYLGNLAREIRVRPERREEFKSVLNFSPYVDMCLAMLLNERMRGGGTETNPVTFLPGDPAFKEPLIRSLQLLITAQYFISAFEGIPEKRENLRNLLQKELNRVLDRWGRQLNNLLAAWNDKFDVPMVSRDTLRYLRRSFTSQFTYDVTFIMEALREPDQTLPFQELHRVPVSELPVKIRNLHTNSIESFVEQRLQSTLRHRVKTLAYIMKLWIFQDVIKNNRMDVVGMRYYLDASIEEIDQILQTR